MSPISAFPAPARDSPPAVLDIPRQSILDYLATVDLSTQLTEGEKFNFISVCQAFHLNPFKREVHIAAYGEGSCRRVSIIVGYEVYLKRADRTGRLNGWSSRVEGEGEQLRAIVEIFRKDWAEPFQHEVYWSEAVQRTKAGTPTSFWSKMPRFQLKKVAISQAFRLCFPDELGGLPYDSSELPDVEALTAAPTVLSALSSSLPSSQSEAPASEATPLPEASDVQDDLSPLSEASPTTARPSPTAPTALFLGYQDPYPDEPQDALLVRLEHYLDDNNMAFTERHREWILSKASQSRDRHGVLKMLSYSEKVVRNTSAVASA